MDLEVLQNEIRKCDKCFLRANIPESLRPQPSLDKQGKILCVKLSPDIDSHLSDLPYSTVEELLLNKVLKIADVPRSSVFFTNLVKCSTQKQTAAKACSAAKVCNEYFQVEVKDKLVIVTMGKVVEDILRKNRQVPEGIQIFPCISMHTLYTGGVRHMKSAAAVFRDSYEYTCQLESRSI